jgi:phenylacetate-CoA ligase
MIDLRSLIEAPHSFSSNPLSFLDSDCKTALSNIMDLILLESSTQKDINIWRKQQIHNLFSHCMTRSSFWRRRIGGGSKGFRKLEDLPVMSRSSLNEQVENEGALLGVKDGALVNKHSTSGSTGTPANFYVTNINGNYNAYRSAAQFIIDGLDLTLNRTRLGYGALASKPESPLSTRNHWLSHLYPFIQSGRNKEIAYVNCSNAEIDRIVRELKKDPIGHLVAGPWMIEPLLRNITPCELHRCGARVFLIYGGRLDSSIRTRLEAADILVSQSYSCEEVGPVAFECKKIKGSYHVATSNVIVETDKTQRLTIDGKSLEKVLITHLHSYATPFIRYDIGDYAILGKSCQCGYTGPVLSDIYGRSKMLLSKPDGTVVPFFIETAYLFDLADIKEYRIRQVSHNRLEAEFVMVECSGDTQATSLSEKLKSVVGDDMHVDVRFVGSIDWGSDTKREGFRNEVLEA